MIKYILFDLDDTLYSKETGVMAAIGERIHQYIQEKVSLDPVGSRALRRHYLQTYGTTLKGLQVHYNVDTEEYLAYVHNVPLGEHLQPDDALDRVLTEIQAQKVVFTNATCEMSTDRLPIGCQCIVNL
jgi:putative hydrolase of the HAD superfamily